MPDALLVIAHEIFRDEEYAEPKRVLTEHGVTVTTASDSPGKCIGKLGMEAWADLDLVVASERVWDAVAFIGGGGAARFFDDPVAHRIARDTLERGAVLGAICIAPSTLAHAGLLGGVRATAFPSQEADLKAHGAVWTGEGVTVSGRIVTANGPESAAAFGDALTTLLGV